MKNRVSVFIIASLLLVMPMPSSAGYLVQLKQGGDFVASDYWEQGNILYFKAFGGTIGLAKHKILSIRETDKGETMGGSVASQETREPREELIETENEIAQGEQGEEENEADKVVAEKKKQELGQKQEEDPTDSQKERKADLIKKLKRHYEFFAKEITKSNKIKIRKRIVDIKSQQKHMKELEVDVRKTNEGALPAWWSAMPAPEPPTGL